MSVSHAATGFSPGLQPYDWNLLSTMHEQLQLQKPHHGRGTVGENEWYSISLMWRLHNSDCLYTVTCLAICSLNNNDNNTIINITDKTLVRISCSLRFIPPRVWSLTSAVCSHSCAQVRSASVLGWWRPGKNAGCGCSQSSLLFVGQELSFWHGNLFIR